MRFEKSLLRGSWIRIVEGGATRHAAHAKEIEFGSFPAEVGVRFIPVHLAFRSPKITLRNERIPTQKPQFLFPLPYILAHPGAANRILRHLLAKALINPLGRVPLFAGSLSIRCEEGVDERLHRVESRTSSWGIRSLGRHRRAEGLPDQAPVNKRCRSIRL